MPGGQGIYIAPSGVVSYVMAHSGLRPEGSLIKGWYNKTVISSCAQISTVLDWVSPAATNQTQTGGVLLCPAPEDAAGRLKATYQLYTRTMGFNQTGCLPAVGVVQHGNSADYGAWQYD